MVWVEAHGGRSPWLGPSLAYRILALKQPDRLIRGSPLLLIWGWARMSVVGQYRKSAALTPMSEAGVTADIAVVVANVCL